MVAQFAALLLIVLGLLPIANWIPAAIRLRGTLIASTEVAERRGDHPRPRSDRRHHRPPLPGAAMASRPLRTRGAALAPRG